ncbi:hypothetical protein SELMODRAFT_431835 [Selaginella moellendorffii]|uniref:Uncharacterized protein n=1 Tax=Selaginella moellendorffii TaxID=88036 RepID=D8TDY6_SELML|nr:hypothetical protein SELMODRAFT_431835 [Selaginella moellendorffii]
MGPRGQKPQGTSFMQNTFTNDSRPGPMHRSPRAVIFKRTIVAYCGYVFRQSLETISSTSGCDQGLLLIASKEEMIIDPQRASSMVLLLSSSFETGTWERCIPLLFLRTWTCFAASCELIKMREKLAMAEARARARLQMQYEDDFFYNYDEWDSFVDLSTLRSSSGECCSISYLLEKWSWLKEQFARIRMSRLLESSTGRWKKAKVTHGVSKPALGLLAKTEETVKRMPLELQENNRPFFLRRGEAASSSEVGAVEQEVRADVILVRQDCWVVRGLVKVGNRVRAIRGLRYDLSFLPGGTPSEHSYFPLLSCYITFLLLARVNS